jgi:hypothetical protein
MHSFITGLNKLFSHNQPFNRKRLLLLTALFLLIFNVSGVLAQSQVLRQPLILQNHIADTVSDRIKDSLRIELLHAKLDDPVTERQYLTRLLKEDQGVTVFKAKKHGQKFYYRLAVAFTKLRLYSLAMKCYFKTLTIENAMDTAKYNPLVTASVDSKQLMTGNFSRQRDSLAIEDSLATGIMNIHSADISLINKDSTAYNGDAEIESTRIKANEIINPFEDGKKAAAYALLIHVRQPLSGKPKVHVLNNVGHTFITLIKYNTDSTIVSRSWGCFCQKKK